MKYRGCQIGPEQADNIKVQTLVYRGCNLIRFQIGAFDTSQEPDPVQAWKDQVIQYTEVLRQLCNQFPNLFVPCVMRLPQSNNASTNSVELLEWAWTHIITEVGSVIAYDILNEPKFSTSMTKALMKRGALTIRTIDPTAKLSLTYPLGDPPHFKDAQTYGIRNAWYEVHMYLPMRLTHQGVNPKYPPGVEYPSGSLNKNKLFELLNPVREFQTKNRRKIFVGEFGISTFTDAGSRYRYVKDCLDIFEEYSWHWCYHSIFEADVWAPDSRINNLLDTYWSKNE